MVAYFIVAAAVAAQPVLAREVSEPRIVVQGVGSVKTPPDIAEISYDVHGEGKTTDEAVSNLAKRTAAIENALRSIDPALQLHSDSVKVETVRGKDCREDSYDDRAIVSTGACAIIGYLATQDFDVRTGRVQDAGTMVGFAARRGASDPKIDDFDVGDTRTAKQQAIAAALAEARTKAQAIANATGAQLGGVATVSLDGAEVQEITVTGSRVRPPAPERDEPIPIAITPEPVVTTARVTVAYAIGS